ncbi:expressed protein [Chlorella variabilis]|uniref:Expressed protein n=1 Tax=Chlorella variabilis TaxID=554065 RepID=E1ZR90_CHLVA|nr:expressed protein [Chlorella variabilis]EFN51737.1 expressed protein [Chlorella variabilis]|eukprot:XP_005843839.1 expressed protein [Chlorella variabilis]
MRQQYCQQWGLTVSADETKAMQLSGGGSHDTEKNRAAGPQHGSRKFSSSATGMEAVGMQLNLDEPQPIGMAALRNAGGNASWSSCYQLPLAKPAAYPREPPTSMRVRSGPGHGVGYLLLALVLFTLKDAAKRGRLGASTFRELNIGVAVVGITGALNLAAGMQASLGASAGYIVQGKLAASKVAVVGATAGLALYNYFCAKK